MLPGTDHFTGAPACARCGRVLPPRAAFCGECGLRVSSIPVGIPLPPPVRSVSMPNAPTPSAPTPSAPTSNTPVLDAPKPEERLLRTGELALMEFLSYIPVLNVILFLVWMFQPGRSVQRARLAQAKLLSAAVFTAAVMLTVAVMALLFRYGMIDRFPMIHFASMAAG